MNNFMIVLHQVHLVYMRQSTAHKNITLRVINKALYNEKVFNGI